MLSNISFDIDGLWVALSYHRIKVSPENDPAIKEGVPRILELLRKYKINTTFFVVGKNIENYKEIHKEIAEEHEIGNHTYSHFHNLSSLPNKKIEFEIEKNHEIIKKLLNKKAVGFRAPTYKIDNTVFEVLKKLNYDYDSSFMPAFYPGITPFTNLFLKRRPHLNKGICEIPVSVNPLIPVFLNGTAIIALGLGWLKYSLKLLKIFNLPAVINFHAKDAIDLPPILKKQFKRGKNDSFLILEQTIKYLKKNSKLSSFEEIAKYYVG